MMKFILSTLLLSISLFFANLALASSGSPAQVPFNDGDVLFQGANNGTDCTGLCIKTERRGNVLLTSVYDQDGSLAKVSADSLTTGPASANDSFSATKASAPVTLHVTKPSGPMTQATGVPDPPHGGNGAVPVSDAFPGPGGYWNRTTIFYFASYQLVNVEVVMKYVTYMAN